MRARPLNGLRRITDGTDKRWLSVDQKSELPPSWSAGFPVDTDRPTRAGETMTDVAPATDAKASPPGNAEDAKLAELGYTQKLDRSVGTLASFAIGFATISATTAVFTGFGAGYFTAGAPFVWTLLLAGAVFALWALIAADLTAKTPARRLLVPVDQSDQRSRSRRCSPAFIALDGLGLRHDRRRLHPVRLPRRPVRLEHESDRPDPRRHRRGVPSACSSTSTVSDSRPW